MAVDFLVVGHVARDLIPGGHRVGGAAYAALAAARLGRRTALVTSAAPDFATASALLDVEVHVIPSPVSTTFENRYPSGRRTQVLHSRAVILLAPIAGELHPADWLPLGRDVAVSLQGLLRRWDEQGRVRASTRALPALHGALAVFFSDEDVPSTAARSRLVARCCEQARFVLLTRGPGGATLYQRGRAEADVPAFRASEADPTGAGDVFAAAFLVRFQETGDPFEAALFAAAAGSLTVEQLGLDGVPTREQIQDRLNGHAAATRAGRAYG